MGKERARVVIPETEVVLNGGDPQQIIRNQRYVASMRDTEDKLLQAIGPNVLGVRIEHTHEIDKDVIGTALYVFEDCSDCVSLWLVVIAKNPKPIGFAYFHTTGHISARANVDRMTNNA